MVTLDNDGEFADRYNSDAAILNVRSINFRWSDSGIPLVLTGDGESGFDSGEEA